jgi:TPP-dependent pyruvate/acetoin dehydrogenase alpha subunit
MSYVPESMFEEWSRRDPIELYAGRLTSDHGFGADEVDTIRAEVREYVEECAAKALSSPMPEPDEGLEGVFAERWEELGDGHAPWSHWSSEGATNGRAAA